MKSLKNTFVRFVSLSFFLLLSSLALAEDVIKKDMAKKESKALPLNESFILDAQFNGPFQDTLIQRWVDKAKGNTCYLYIPVIVPNFDRQAQDKQTGQPTNPKPGPKIYGPNTIGSISCVGS
jgi:hypothetical protein